MEFLSPAYGLSFPFQSGLKRKLEELKQNLDWIERMDLTNAPAPAPRGTEAAEQMNTDESVHDDFKRELIL